MLWIAVKLANVNLLTSWKDWYRTLVLYTPKHERSGVFFCLNIFTFIPIDILQIDDKRLKFT